MCMCVYSTFKVLVEMLALIRNSELYKVHVYTLPLINSSVALVVYSGNTRHFYISVCHHSTGKDIPHINNITYTYTCTCTCIYMYISGTYEWRSCEGAYNFRYVHVRKTIEMIIALLLQATKVPNNLPFNQRIASSNHASTPVLVVVILSKHMHTQNVTNALRGSNFNFLKLYLYASLRLHRSYAPDIHDIKWIVTP